MQQREPLIRDDSHFGVSIKVEVLDADMSEQSVQMRRRDNLISLQNKIATASLSIKPGLNPITVRRSAGIMGNVGNYETVKKSTYEVLIIKCMFCSSNIYLFYHLLQLAVGCALV